MSPPTETGDMIQVVGSPHPETERIVSQVDFGRIGSFSGRSDAFAVDWSDDGKDRDSDHALVEFVVRF